MSNNHFPLPTAYQEFIALSRYARWMENLGRREVWSETVDRYVDGVMVSSIEKHAKNNKEKHYMLQEAKRIRSSIGNLKSMPSMRCMMTAGIALERDHVAAYNCSYAPIQDAIVIDEVMRILLCGTGAGFSVENQFVRQLNRLPEKLVYIDTTIVVEDSKEGWADAFRQYLALLWSGFIPNVDPSKVRPKGARLKTFGGRASGPEPLMELLEFCKEVFKRFLGGYLTDIAVHDIMCKVGEVVVVGGVRRSAMISLSDIDSFPMAMAKSMFPIVGKPEVGLEDDTSIEITFTFEDYGYGQTTKTMLLNKAKQKFDIEGILYARSVGWWLVHPQRALANNSIAYQEKPTKTVFDREWQNLIDSGSGERGIFNREASVRQAAKNGRRNVLKEGYSTSLLDGPYDPNKYIPFGTNPCSEIILRPFQFCNLSEVVARPEDSFEDLKQKVIDATILGTLQSTKTDFPFLREIWKKNTEEERLLGVSITGITDNDLLKLSSNLDSIEEVLEVLKQVAVDTNKLWADMLGIPVSAAITCVKPSGTVSQLVDSASGIHARHSLYYIRTVRGDNKDPITQFMQSIGIPNEPDVMKPDSTVVFSFPMKSPENGVFRKDMSAIEQLELWLTYQRHWCEHKPSVTVSVKPEEWEEVGEFVYKYFDEMSGVSFLPFSDAKYEQMPYQDCSDVKYFALLSKIPSEIDWDELSIFERGDTTAGSQTLACAAGACEIVDLV